MSILLLAPVGLDHNCWQWLDLGDAPVIAHDMPGFGGRPRNPQRATIGDWVEDVVEHLARAVHGPVDVVGCSLGAMVAQNLALMRPDLVRSLVLACTGASSDPAVMRGRAERAETVGIAGMLDDTLQRWFTPRTLAADPVHPGVDCARSTLLALDPGAFADAWRVIGTHDVTARLEQILVPTTCIAALGDQAAPLPRVRVLADGIPGARLVTLPGAHMVHLEEPAEFSQTVIEHLARVNSSARVRTERGSV